MAAVVGGFHLGVRLQVIAGALPPEVLVAADSWPTLYSSLEEMIAYRPEVNSNRRQDS